MYLLTLVLYGVILTAIIGLVASWIDRKVTARIQYRVGPPFLQPFRDILNFSVKRRLYQRDLPRRYSYSHP